MCAKKARPRTAAEMAKAFFMGGDVEHSRATAGVLTLNPAQTDTAPIGGAAEQQSAMHGE